MRSNVTAWATGLVASLSISTASALADVGDIPDRNIRYYDGHAMMWGGGQWGGFGMVLGPVFMILLLVAIAIGVVYLLRHFGIAATTTGDRSADRALTLLRERYARGEIDSKEFEERKRLLEG